MKNGLRNLLVEIGTEELPPLALETLSRAFESGMLAALKAAGVPALTSERYATPRRLAVWLQDVPVRQADQPFERKGPALRAAFDEEGAPTAAAKGFARSCGVSVEQLETLNTDQGSWLVFREMRGGQQTVDIVPGILSRVLGELPTPKRMRWGAGSSAFVRPVHWLLLLFGTEAIPFEVFGVRAGSHTRGHRFLCQAPILIASADSYASELRENGYVLPSFAERREKVREGVMESAAAVGGEAIIAPDLLDEVTALVEWPVPVAGSFDPRFLDTPKEALVSTMEKHQKYFPVVDGNGELMANFIAVSNLESLEPSEVRRGNERVIRPRFSDAEFFWVQDRKKSLSSRRDDLRRVIYERRLGSLFDKSERVAELAGVIATEIGADASLARRAGELCKCDLVSSMVGEFPELQGVMGRYYAMAGGETEEVAEAIGEHYLPRFAGDKLPRSILGQALALADRLDTLAATFSVGKQPTGAKDPYGLRRIGLGILRILIEQDIPLDLREFLGRAVALLPEDLKEESAAETLLQFVTERLRTYYVDNGVRPEVFAAVIACHPTQPLDVNRRIQALEKFSQMAACSSLVSANKRIRNILRRADAVVSSGFNDQLLEDGAEKVLAEAVRKTTTDISPLLRVGDYEGVLTRLAELRTPVDRFFDEVMVMVEDGAVRMNRLGLLKNLHKLFLEVADISLLQASG